MGVNGSYGNLWAQWVDLVQSYENKGTVCQHNCPIMWLIVRMTGFRRDIKQPEEQGRGVSGCYSQGVISWLSA